MESTKNAMRSDDGNSPTKEITPATDQDSRSGASKEDASAMDVESSNSQVSAFEPPEFCFDAKSDMSSITELWHQLDKDTKESTVGFKVSERHKKGEGSLSRLYNHSKKKVKHALNIEEWRKLFREHAVKKKSKRTLSFALKLATTSPEYFSTTNWKDSKLTTGDITVTWAAAHSTFGSVFKHLEQLFDFHAPVKPITNLGKEFSKGKIYPQASHLRECSLTKSFRSTIWKEEVGNTSTPNIGVSPLHKNGR